MSRHNRRHDRPIELVELRMSFRTSNEIALHARDLIPEVRLKRGGFEFTIEGESPGEVARKAKASLERLRKAIKPPKAFK